MLELAAVKVGVRVGVAAVVGEGVEVGLGVLVGIGVRVGLGVGRGVGVGMGLARPGLAVVKIQSVGETFAQLRSLGADS